MTVHAQEPVRSVLLSPQTATATANVTANLDTRGSDYAVVNVAFSSELNTNAINPTISLLESDDTEVTNFATVVADRVQDLTATSAHHYFVDLKTRKRYLRLSITPGTTAGNDAVTLCADAELWRQQELPASTTEMVASGDTVTLVAS